MVGKGCKGQACTEGPEGRGPDTGPRGTECGVSPALAGPLLTAAQSEGATSFGGWGAVVLILHLRAGVTGQSLCESSLRFHLGFLPACAL